ncbi:MAG: MEDS domain-containing protein, partial [Chloroflexi bacterium]|nr:MEDS domain-containing protein [Chloroflexota bacterium]
MREARDTGIAAVGDVLWGAHICHFYQSKYDLIEVLVPYFKAGLGCNELCVWVTAEPVGEDEAREAMRQATPDFDRYLSTGQMVITPHDSWYLRDGAFVPQMVIDGWDQKLSQALAKGYDGLRASGSLGWLENRDWLSFTAYEERLHDFLNGHHVIVVCCYPQGRCGPSEVIDILHNHSSSLIRRDGGWKLVRDMHLRLAEEKPQKPEQDYRFLFDNMIDGVFAVDGETLRVVGGNQRAATMFGFASPGDATGVDPLQLVHPEDRDRAFKIMMEDGFGRDLRQVNEFRVIARDGREVWIEAVGAVTKYAGRPLNLVSVRDVTQRRKAEQDVARHHAVVDGINTILRETLNCQTEEDLARTCLRVAESLTASKCGWIGEVNGKGGLDVIAVSDPGWEACALTAAGDRQLLRNMELRGIWARVLKDDRPVIVNDPAADPDQAGMPQGHPALSCFLGMPLRNMGQSTGMIVLGNKEGGYSTADIDVVECLAVSIVEALMRKRAEEARQQSEARLSHVAENALSWIWELDADGMLTYASSVCVKVVGYKPEEIVGRRFGDDLLPEESEKWLDAFRKTRDRNLPFRDVEYRVGFPVLSEKGELLGYRGATTDITRRRESEEEVLRRNRDLSALQQALLSISRSLDLGQVLHEIVSQAGTALESIYTSITLVNEDGSLGIVEERSSDQPPLRFRARPSGTTRTIIATGEAMVIDDVDADKSTNPAVVAAGIKSYAGAPIKSNGAVTGILFVHSKNPNAFGRRMELLHAFASQAAIAIENARLYKEAATTGALREADRLKTELLANVSHELRTPLALIKGYCTSMLRFYNKLDDEERIDSLQEINMASDRLAKLVENLLELSGMEAADFRLRMETVNIAFIVRYATREVAARAREYHFIKLVPKGLPLVKADPDRTRQVL